MCQFRLCGPLRVGQRSLMGGGSGLGQGGWNSGESSVTSRRLR